jgi:hypothetical protein
MDYSDKHVVNIDELATHPVTRQELLVVWNVDGVSPADLLAFLNAKPDGKIVFVDCQDAQGTSSWLRCHWMLATALGCYLRKIT